MAGGYVVGDVSTIGTRIRQRRLELGLTQRDLAGPGVSPSYVSLIEDDRRRPSIKALRRLAPKLDVSVVWLETGVDDPAAVLARLVLEHTGRPLPAEAIVIAETLLAY